MADTRQELVLHLVGAVQPLHIALDPAEAETLGERLADLMSGGGSRSLATADGGHFTVNFTHVATAHLERTRSDAHAYGAPSRGTGFGS
ncbi:hypothetical protein [Parasphingorhabdus pacifica]